MVHGGDWGSHVGRDLAAADGAHVAGLHVTMTPGPAMDGDPAAAEKAAYYARELSGYNKLQATRPLSLAPALTDSPPTSSGMWRQRAASRWSAATRAPTRPARSTTTSC